MKREIVERGLPQMPAYFNFWRFCRTGKSGPAEKDRDSRQTTNDERVPYWQFFGPERVPIWQFFGGVKMLLTFAPNGTIL